MIDVIKAEDGKNKTETESGRLTRAKNLLLDGLLRQNPVLVQFLGLCPMLAVSTTVVNGVGMGLSTAAALICSNVVIALLRAFIPRQVRIAAYVVVIAGFATIVDLLLRAYLPELSGSLGLFIPLIAVNCIIIARAEKFASKNTVFDALIDGLGMGMGFTAVLIILSSVREILGSGTWFGIQVFGEGYQPALMMILPPGGFLALGTLIATARYFMRKYGDRTVGKGE